MFSPDKQEMILYFSSFLTDINAITNNIKQYVYQLVNITLPVPTASKVYQSMSSIILSTHRTFQDLKKIESIVHGVIRSRRTNKKQSSLSPLSTDAMSQRSKSSEGQLFYSPFQQLKIRTNCCDLSQSSDGKYPKTIKRNKRWQKTQPQNKQNGPNKYEAGVDNQKQNMGDKQDTTTVKNTHEKKLNQVNEQKKMEGSKSLLVSIEARLKAIVMSNKSNLQKNIDRNRDCIQMIRSVKKDIMHYCPRRETS